MDTTIYGPSVPYCAELHAQKYRSDGESFSEAMTRIAAVLKDNDDHFHEFRDALLNMRFMPGGRIQAAIGSTKNVTAMNCFVIPVEDSFVTGPNSIMEAATNAAATMRMGGGVGYTFGHLRPRGAMIKKLQSQSSGPISFMEIFDAVCRCTSSSGHRRGAQMGVLPIWHPDIEEFVHAKTRDGKLEGFNISVAVTDKFMQCLQTGKPFPLEFEGQVYREIDAAALWDQIMRNTWDWAEPGVIFIDQINRMNNLYYCETLEATNPCAEQPLAPFGSCLLGSFNLAKYVSTRGDGLNWELLRYDIHNVVRAMDNVIDHAIYPLIQQQQEMINKRRMGLGVTGLANALEYAYNTSYGSYGFVTYEDLLLQSITNECYLASAYLAREKGAFPLYNAEKYLQGQFIQKLSPDVREAIRLYGIRNSHLTSIAPTGTISLCADNVSSGIEPVFDYSFDRTVIEFAGPRVETVTDYGLDKLQTRGKRASEVTAKEHVDVLVTAQKWVDSAVSKTVNCSSAVSWDAFKQIYTDVWSRGGKGCATFRVDGKRKGILISDEGKVCRILSDGRRECE